MYSAAAAAAKSLQSCPTLYDPIDGSLPGFPGGSDSRHGFDPWAGKIPWRREWLPTPVFFLGEFHGERSLAGYSPRVCRQSDTTKQLTARGQSLPAATIPLPSAPEVSWNL